MQSLSKDSHQKMDSLKASYKSTAQKSSASCAQDSARERICVPQQYRMPISAVSAQEQVHLEQRQKAPPPKTPAAQRLADESRRHLLEGAREHVVKTI